MRNLKGFTAAAAGVGIGLILADLADRFIATRKPADSTPTTATANGPWYGRDAAAAQRMRPDAYRLGGQAAGAVVAMVGAYATRRLRVGPWLFGGLAIGFGANLLKMLSDYWIAPAVLNVKSADEATLANRLYPLEQKAVQDQVAKSFADWASTASLAAGQQNPPVVMSPLAGGTDVYALGGRPNGYRLGTPRFVSTGRVGLCSSCGAMNGCYSNCPALCETCPGGQKLCAYTVGPTDDINAWAAKVGADINEVNSLNGGGPPSTYWHAGATVKLPYAICTAIEQAGGGTGPYAQPGGTVPTGTGPSPGLIPGVPPGVTPGGGGGYGGGGSTTIPGGGGGFVPGGGYVPGQPSATPQKGIPVYGGRNVPLVPNFNPALVPSSNAQTLHGVSEYQSTQSRMRGFGNE